MWLAPPIGNSYLPSNSRNEGTNEPLDPAIGSGSVANPDYSVLRSVAPSTSPVCLDESGLVRPPEMAEGCPEYLAVAATHRGCSRYVGVEEQGEQLI
jgi:hypothetical protein